MTNDKTKKLPGLLTGVTGRVVRGNVIDVYLGFMDEEVNARLKKLIDVQKEAEDRKARPVILIERGQVKPDKPILEWRLGNYKIGDKDQPVKRIIHVSPLGLRDATKDGGLKKDDYTLPEEILANAMSVFMEWDLASDLDWLARGLRVKRYFDILQLLSHRRGEKTKTPLPGSVDKAKWTDEEGKKPPTLSVVRFDVGKDENPPIIVIRTPEMGLQPSLMCPYIAFLFKAISAMSSELVKVHSGDKFKKQVSKGMLGEWPLRVSQFGAQGSTTLAKEPGTTDAVVASLFVGAEISSDITVTATDHKQHLEVEATYKQSADSPEAPPHHAAQQRLKPDDKPIDDHSYRDYQDIKLKKSSIRAYAVISLCTPAGVYDFVRVNITNKGQVDNLVDKFGLPEDLKGVGNETPEQVADRAQELAKAIYHTQENSRKHKLLKLQSKKVYSTSPFYSLEDRKIKGKFFGLAKPSLKRVINKVKEAYKDKKGVVTLTVSYFGGDEDKKAADELGIEGVAMEDYHVLRILRSAIATGASLASDYPIIKDCRIDRINCDPREIPGSVIKAFGEYAGSKDSKKLNAMLKVEDYVKVIIWGLRGVLRGDIEKNDDLKETIRWKFLNDRDIFKDIEDLKTYFWSFFDHKDKMEDFWVPDPFCIEIATDFVNELAELKATQEERTKKGKVGPPGGIAGIENTLKKAVDLQILRGLAREVLNKWESDKDNEELNYMYGHNSDTAEAITKLMAYLLLKCDFAVKKPEGELQKNIKDFVEGKKNAPKEIHQLLLKTWLRPDKWSTSIKKATLQDDAENFDGAAVDRAFYKSSNMMALQTMADWFLWEGGPRQIATGSSYTTLAKNWQKAKKGIKPPKQKVKKPVSSPKPAPPPKKKYNIVGIKGDGNCLFRAVAKSSGSNDDETHANLRKQAVDRMRDKPADYTLKRLKEEYSYTIDSTEDYFEEMGSPVTDATKDGRKRWGGLQELRALSAVLKKPIHVYMEHLDSPLEINGDDTATAPPDAQPIKIHYRGQNHYSSVE